MNFTRSSRRLPSPITGTPNLSIIFWTCSRGHPLAARQRCSNTIMLIKTTLTNFPHSTANPSNPIHPAVYVSCFLTKISQVENHSRYMPNATASLATWFCARPISNGWDAPSYAHRSKMETVSLFIVWRHSVHIFVGTVSL